ncbi:MULTISPECIES: ketose-bisphosphate aldolase [unclassified Brenneria]|uniref:ketose-bisphosphate aldolase n=1 Tax=unclassified Brenneria TaxID=2634434 RepID=UPI0029C46A22|nr:MULTISPECIES: ketose-bisphosphate aldolase [unclassified Brenneria]MDX5627274.1 ketose-bisphosphate aldolase [Brenneria sp. L3-3Z]MDX5694570.1 ketose-bisphosphate aldolase [Brenneria sp. L4-2C]MEE3661822.1 ketose-bisphosphate aldolase [Brenneria sp. g21c3]
MLYNMKDLLLVARQHQFGVGAFNIASAEFARAVIETAEKHASPVILEIHPDEMSFTGSDFIIYLRALATKAAVPVVIHLDHGRNLQEVMQAIYAGFTSVMIDASAHPFEENIRLTKKIVELAHTVNISVEAELGTIGVAEGSAEGGSSEILYTDPQQAKTFVEETGVDTLAVAIGTSHGLYPKGKQPKLDIERLQQIRQVVTIPLVLHGGSGNKDSEVAEAIRFGVGKVNISSEMKKAFFVALEEELKQGGHEPNALYLAPMEAARKVIAGKMALFNSIDKAALYLN